MKVDGASTPTASVLADEVSLGHFLYFNDSNTPDVEAHTATL